MKKLLRIVSWLLLGSVGSAFAAAPATLTINDLRGHSDRWPTNVTLQRDFKFNGGQAARKGQSVHVVEFDGQALTVDAGHDLVFNVPPAETDFVAAANVAWGKLTPAQRELDQAKVFADASLWPLKVVSSSGYTLDAGGNLPPGREYDLVSYGRDGALIFSHQPKATIPTDLTAVDVMPRARQLALMPRGQRPARIPLELKGNLFDASGHKVASAQVEEAQIFLLYYGASWCGPCRQFSPSLVKFVNELGPKNPKLGVVMMSNDKVDAELFEYMKKENMPWPAMLLSKLNDSPSLLSYTKGAIPQLVIVDRYGKVLADAYQGDRYVGPKFALDSLSRILASGAGRTDASGASALQQ